MDENQIGDIFVSSAIEVHRELGPGLLESVYEVVLTDLLSERGLQVQRQVPVPIEFRGKIFSEGFRADLILNRTVIIEIKSVETLNNAHKKQVLTYLKLMDLKLGYLANFSADLMKNGLKRIINGQI